MATIEGRNASDWIKSAKERQSRGEFDETGANEARQAVNGRQIPRTRGGVRGIYAFRPTKDKPSPKPTTNPTPAPTRASSQSEQQIAKAPAPARKESAMPKAETHASPMAPVRSAENIRSEAPKPIRKQMGDYGTEQEWNTARDEAKKRGRVGNIIHRANDEGASSLRRLQDEARAKSADTIEKREQRESDEWQAKNVLEKAKESVGKYIDKPATAAAKKVLSTSGRQWRGVVKYVGSEMDKGMRMYTGIGRWLRGDPEAKKRLAAK